MVTAPHLSPKVEKKKKTGSDPLPCHSSTFRSPIRFYLGLAVCLALGLIHFVDLIADKSFAAYPILFSGSQPQVQISPF